MMSKPGDKRTDRAAAWDCFLAEGGEDRTKLNDVNM